MFSGMILSEFNEVKYIVIKSFKNREYKILDLRNIILKNKKLASNLI